MQSVLQICSGTEWEFDMKKKLIQATCLFFVMRISMERVKIADQIIDLEVSDQGFFKKRLQEYAIVDMNQKSDMNLTTCVLDEIVVPEGNVIKKVRDA